MKYLTFATQEDVHRPLLGALRDQAVVDLDAARAWAYAARGLPLEPLPNSLFELIHAGAAAWAYARNLINVLEGEDALQLKGPRERPLAYPLEQVQLYPPLPRPAGLRDFYAFEAHVTNAHAARNKPVPEEWYQFPVFYFSNPNAIFGPGEVVPQPGYTQALDYELEVACVVGRPGVDISVDQAEDYIFGYTILNDWSARDIQRLEMRVGLGPAKGKDFASSLGPWIVTPDELVDRATGRPGVYDLQMTARVNGKEASRGNWKDLYFSFGEMIARASASTYLLPGEVIGSGTVGSGCLLELTAGQGPWLKPGDLVDLEIERLGNLVNPVGEPRQPVPG
ncbi:MAG TPA: fumarylacetoacetate hydrolase family protein [Anaerolineales bacterium]|nr:fumarylacetoacetate hydrolase family protein [Anaerolineales bacterium]